MRDRLPGAGWAVAVAVAAIVLTVGPIGIEAGGFLRVESEAAVRGGRLVVAGHVHNDNGAWVHNVRLLVESVDATERVVGRTYGYVAGGVPPKSRAYFEVRPRGTPEGSRLRVTVHSFDWLTPSPP